MAKRRNKLEELSGNALEQWLIENCKADSYNPLSFSNFLREAGFEINDVHDRVEFIVALNNLLAQNKARVLCLAFFTGDAAKNPKQPITFYPIFTLKPLPTKVGC